MTRLQTAVAAALLFVLAVLIRLPHLGAFLTPDEQRIWTTLTGEFMAALLRGDWAATATSGYPGVTTTWAGSLGLALQWLIARPPDVAGLAGMAEALVAAPSRLDMLPWVRLGVVLASAGGVVVVFLLARRLFDDAVALLAAGLLLFDPFLLAHTRILNTDPLLALALTISWLALVIGAGSGQRRYLVLSGVAFGLALLTKTPALLVAPLMMAWIFWQQGHRRSSARDVVRNGVIDLACFGLAAALTCILLWPALWVAPIVTIERSLAFASALSQTGHELGNYWLGQPVAGPGALFYPAVLLWRTTPATLIGLALALGAAIASVRRRRSSEPAGRTAGSGAAWALLVYVAWFALAMSFSPKKFDRYLLPVFPLIDLLAAWGWIVAVRWSASAWQRRVAARQAGRVPRFGGKQASSPAPRSRTAGWVIAACVLAIGLQAGMAANGLPSYLTVYNPLAGGLRTAQQVMLVGWGEGLEEAAAFLDQRPGAGNHRVAAWYGQNVFAPFFRGQSFDLQYDVRTAVDLYANDVDAVVTYVNQMQRQLVDPSVLVRLGTPIMESRSAGVPLAQVYRWPKPFAHTTDRTMSDGLRLLGWAVGPFDPATRQLPVRLYWDADVADAGNLSPVEGWLKDASGEVWATVAQRPDVAPAQIVEGWADHRALEQTLSLQLPAGLVAGEYRIEMAPEGSQGFGLGSVGIPASYYDQVASGDVLPPPAPVVFGDAAQFVGFDLRTDNGPWQIDLLWAARTPLPDTKFFVHGVNSAGQVVAQVDGELAAVAGEGWQQGQMARQRVRIEWPESLDGDRRLYLGLYDPDTGQRLPATLGGQRLPEDRYQLR